MSLRLVSRFTGLFVDRIWLRSGTAFSILCAASGAIAQELPASRQQQVPAEQPQTVPSPPATTPAGNEAELPQIVVTASKPKPKAKPKPNAAAAQRTAQQADAPTPRRRPWTPR